MLLPYGERDPRVQVEFMDITMLAIEFGTSISDVPPHHPDVGNFSANRPYYDQAFHIVLCDGNVLPHMRISGAWRPKREATRLRTAQLILGMQRIKSGGTFINSRVVGIAGRT